MMTDLLYSVPRVLRARGWRLYTNSGRLVDLWQYGGRALLGHNPPGLLQVIKNNSERSLFAPLPHIAEDRFRKALSALFPDHSFLLSDSEASLRQAINAVSGDRLPEKLPHWRPFSGKETQAAALAAPAFLPALPCPFPGAPAVLALTDEKSAEQFPPSQLLSPVALSAATRCIYDLLSAGERGKPRLPKTDGAIKKSAHWKRDGIYLFFTGNNYTELLLNFLEGGFLLPPSPEEPAILPGELSPGEDAKLAGLILII